MLVFFTSGKIKNKKGEYMKSYLVLIMCMALAASPVLAAEKLELKTDKDKVSYAIGMDIGNGLKKNEVDVNPEIIARAIKDVQSGNKPMMSEEEVKTTLMGFQRELQTKQQARMKAEGEKNKKEGEAFLAKNKTKKGVKTLPSGLQYQVITEGKGKSPKATDTVTVQYRGMLIDGTEFDSSYKHGQAATFPVGGVIKGWTEALQHMKEGSKWKIFVPSDLAYGERGTPGGPIGPNAVLIFEVELVSIKAPGK
jgi:FKBP-type peptidyl-prolyl cis-trans isomerase FklB